MLFQIHTCITALILIQKNKFNGHFQKVQSHLNSSQTQLHTCISTFQVTFLAALTSHSLLGKVQASKG